MGIGLGFGAGPLRIYVPLTGGRKPRKKVPFWTHENCPTRHRSLEAAKACYERSEAAWQKKEAARIKALRAARAKPPVAATAVPAAPAAWYPVPGAPGVLRWWDGTAWTNHIHRVGQESGATRGAVTPVAVPGRSVPAGWYPDPGVPGGSRWWDGTTWTNQALSHHQEQPPAAAANE